MTWVDLVLLLFIVFALWKGWRDGLVRQVVSVVGVVLAYVVSRMFYLALTPWVTRFLKLPVDSHNPLRTFLHGDLQIAIAFALLFGLTYAAVKLLGLILDSVAKLPGLSVLNRVSGLVLGGVVAVLVAALVVNLLHLVPNTALQHALRGSAVAQFFIWKFGGVLPQPSSL